MISIHGSRVTGMAWLMAAAMGAVLALRVSERVAARPGSDFNSYDTAARLVVEGAAIPDFYNNDWFNSQVHRFRSDVHEIYNANMPTMALAALPLALFANPRAARLAFLVLNAGVLLLLLEGCARVAGLRGAWRPLFFAAALGSRPVAENFFLGQMYILVAAALLLVSHDLIRRRQRRAGIVMALLLTFKTAGGLIWLMLPVVRCRRALGWAVGGVLVIVVVSWPMIGLEGWLAYGEAIADLSRSPALRATAYQTVNSFFLHILSGPGDIFGTPLIAAPPWLARVMALGATIGLSTVSLLLIHRRREDPALAFAAFLMLTLICTPLSQIHAYAVSLIAMAIILGRLRDRPDRVAGLVLGLGAATILLPLPFRAHRLVDGAAALLAYPMLYGAGLLWGLSLWLLWTGPDQPARRPAAKEKPMAPG